jgi:murein DD-endopeptidase MepM/ murein hydrolase activator NlpD
VQTVPAPAAPIIQPTVRLFGMVVNDLNVSQDVVKRNQRFPDLFNGYSISNELLAKLNSLPRKVFDFRRIAAGRRYTLISDNDSLKTVQALVYEPNAIDYVIFHLKDSLFVEECERTVQTVERNIAGEIQSTLSETIEQLGISHELTNKFVDIFAWQVDFQHLQKGDKFKLIYEENLVEDRPIGVGRILGIYFEHFGSPLYAFPFDQGDGIDYFDDQGKSLRKALLKYPIEFTSISSRYNLNRFHPVMKVYRPHLGTDFAAPTGTPIRSVGDGVVEEARYTSGNGNYVKIRHNGTYQTAYLHMSRIGSGMAPGVRVRQGQTIGFVGSTGLASGPHVCYRFWRNGVQVDALRVELPPSQPVKKEYLDQFEKTKIALISRLSLIPFATSASEVIVAAR